MRVRLALFAALVATAAARAQAPAAAADAKKVDITGSWQFSVETEAGTGTPSVTFKQDGETITGRYISQLLGNHDFKGTLKDGKLAFSFDADAQGQAFKMTFNGTVDGDSSMKGSVDLGGLASGTFTGKKEKPAEKP